MKLKLEEKKESENVVHRITKRGKTFLNVDTFLKFWLRDRMLALSDYFLYSRVLLTKQDKICFINLLKNCCTLTFILFLNL